MKALAQEERSVLLSLRNELTVRYEEFRARKLSLDMTRGDPAQIS